MHYKGIWLILAAAAVMPAASASVIYSIEPVTPVAQPGDVGDVFEVLLNNTGPSISVGAFTFGVTTTDTDITFVSADTSTTADPYIFAGYSLDDDFSVPLNATSGSSLEADDASFPVLGVTVGTDQTVSLGRVLYDVAPGAALGSFTITFTTDPGDNSLSDPDANAINIDSLQSAQVPIGSSVPEPASLLLVPAGLLALRRRRARWVHPPASVRLNIESEPRP